MARGVFMDNTDYSTQSLKEVLSDINSWIENITEVKTTFEEILQELEVSGYKNKVDFNFMMSCHNLIEFFDTAINDLNEVVLGINTEIKEYHVKLVSNLGKNARILYDRHRKTWKEYEGKEYGEPTFNKVEHLYGEGSGMTGDMLDLNNLAKRLQDFIGRVVSGNQSNTVNVTNNFNSSVSAVQQNYNSSQITQNVEQAQKDAFNEMKEMVSEIKSLLDSLEDGNDKQEIEENLKDLEVTLAEDTPKKNRIKSFAGSVSTGLNKIFSMKTFNKVDELSTKLPKTIDNLQTLIDKL